MSATRKSGVGVAIVVGLVLVAVGFLGYDVEGSRRRERPDGAGFGLPWSHELHARHPDFSCQSCHHTSKAGQTDMQACGSCHPTSPDIGQAQPEQRTPNKASDRRHAMHSRCVGCHKAVGSGPVQCAECHEPGHGTVFCSTCHESTLETLVAGEHADVACESCHGADARRLVHDQHATKVPSASEPARCLACHGDGERDAAGMPVKRASDCPSHARGATGAQTCLSCHPAHSPRAKRR